VSFFKQLLDLWPFAFKRKNGTRVGLSDVGVNATWDPNDGKLIDKEFELIRRQLIPPNFQDKLNRARDDQTVHFETGKLFEPIYVTKEKWDMVTLGGMNRMGMLAVGRSNRWFDIMAVGTGDADESAQDKKLEAEHARVSMVTDGFSEAPGANMRFGGKFSTTLASATIYEQGVFAPSNQPGGEPVMLYRTRFDEDNKIVHKQFQTDFTPTQTVSMISIS
jgi:hypothetical protein